MSATVTVLSGYGAKAAAAILVETANARLLLDAGGSLAAHESKGWEYPEDLDAIIITHDHVDHCAGLDQLAYSVPVYATAPVAQLLPASLTIELLPLRGTVEIAGIDLTVGQAGHSLGGIWLHLAIADGVFYSGDFSLESQLFPFDMPPAAALALVDASYGLYWQSAQEAKQQLVTHLTCEQQVILPVPPSGRALEIALWLISLGIEDFSLDPQCLAASIGWLDEPALFFKGCTEQFNFIRQLAYNDRASIIICADADGAGGEALRLMSDNSRDIRTVYTGYLPPKAYADVASGTAHCIRWNVHPRACDITRLIDYLQVERCLPLFCRIDDQQQWLASVSEQLIFTPQIQVTYATNC